MADVIKTFNKSLEKINNQRNTNTNNNKAGYTNYTSLTWNQVTKNTPGWTASDLSYMKPTAYYGTNKNWDKSADIDNDPDRLNEVTYNVWQDQIVNPKLFTNRNDYNKYYKYDEASPSQQRLYDELWENANKYWLDSYQNKTADDASKVLDDKNRAQYQIMQDYVNTSKQVADLVRTRLDDRLQPMFNEIQAMQTEWLNDYAELRQMQKEYYANVKKEYDAAKAWESASLVSQLSWQWVASGIIANAVAWQDKVWGNRYNELMRNHIETLRDLTDKTQAFMTNIWNTKNNLTKTEQDMLESWRDKILWLDEQLANQAKQWEADIRSPYEAATQAKVTWMNEWLQTQGKRDSKNANYKETDMDNWITQMKSDVWAVLQTSDASTMWNIYTLAKYAWEKFNWNPAAAAEYVYNQLWIKPKSSTTSDDLWDPTSPETMTKYKTYEEYQKAFWSKAVDRATYYSNLISK